MKSMACSVSFVAALLLASSPAAACAPAFQCAGPVCWYALLNDSEFEGTSCTPGWVGASDIQSTGGCTYASYDDFAVVSAADTTFRQDFEVPGTYLDYVELEVSVEFITEGSPSWWDRLYLRLEDRNGNLLQRIDIRTDQGPFGCRNETYHFTGNYRGRDDLRLVVAGQFVTSGVEFWVNRIQIFDNL